VRVGQLAVAIGSPFGLEQSVTAGIVSAINRAVTTENIYDGSIAVVEMIQTDAPINPGNSGGALVDRQGRVVGMNTLIRTDGVVEGNIGVGFAIPTDTIFLVAERITNGESLESGFLGISGQNPTLGRAGALVISVVMGSPADSAGLETGDLIIAVDDAPILGMSELAARIRLSSPGTTLEVTVLRNGEQMTFTVVLAALGRFD
ncbi:MAG TPA: PDZ domain-containing protein, partial [Acidimicrobiales bacterium]|nr:PDZ domain-containing protein [Acidimicrobiales bacterium]